MRRIESPTIMNIHKEKSIYLPGLNGIRAIAAIAVLISHITLALGEFGLDDKIFGTDQFGNASGLKLAGYGVIMFFTLSGFLITYLLLQEKEKIGEIKMKDFYLRRILRIWPLYYLYLLMALVIIFSYHLPLYKSSIPFYIFLAANIPFIIGTSLPLLAHYWSLGVEEQFYLFFPYIVKVKNRKLVFYIVFIILFLILLKFFFWYLNKYKLITLPFTIINVIAIHTMLIGALGATLYYLQHAFFIKIFTNRIVQLIAWLIIGLTAINKFHLASVIDGEIISIVSVVLILGQITKTSPFINLENRFFDFIGKISYGIYVIHPIVIFYFSKMIGKFSSSKIENYMMVYLIISLSTIVISYCSYEYFEKPFLKLKRKYTTIKSLSIKPSN